MNGLPHSGVPASSDLAFIWQSSASESNTVQAPGQARPTVEELQDHVSTPGDRGASEPTWPARRKLSENGDITGDLNKRRELGYWLTASDWEPNLRRDCHA